MDSSHDVKVEAYQKHKALCEEYLTQLRRAFFEVSHCLPSPPTRVRSKRVAPLVLGISAISVALGARAAYRYGYAGSDYNRTGMLKERDEPMNATIEDLQRSLASARIQLS